MRTQLRNIIFIYRPCRQGFFMILYDAIKSTIQQKSIESCKHKLNIHRKMKISKKNDKIHFKISEAKNQPYLPIPFTKTFLTHV